MSPSPQSTDRLERVESLITDIHRHVIGGFHEGEYREGMETRLKRCEDTDAKQREAISGVRNWTLGAIGAMLIAVLTSVWQWATKYTAS